MTVSFIKMLEARNECGNTRHLKAPSSLIDFSSNDYLGLARSSQLTAAVLQEWEENCGELNGLGSTGSRLLTGNSLYAQNLEKKISQFHGYEAGLIFSCGYMANLALLSTVGGDADTIFFDSEIHASMRHGIHLSRSKAFPFRHNDCCHLEHRLMRIPCKGNRYICIESIYSTDGSKAPLATICKLAQQYEAYLIVDEAHATGVYGPCGKGLVAEENLTRHVFAQITTFGKGLGVYGAIILGDQRLMDALINLASPFIYTTALPLFSLAAISCSYELFPDFTFERMRLQKLIELFRNAFLNASVTHIQPIRIQGNRRVRTAARKIGEAGFDVSVLMSPTVRKGHEMLRVCLHAFNTEDEVRILIRHLDFYGGAL